jgi:hypothetical protein
MAQKLASRIILFQFPANLTDSAFQRDLPATLYPANFLCPGWRLANDMTLNFYRITLPFAPALLLTAMYYKSAIT